MKKSIICISLLPVFCAVAALGGCSPENPEKDKEPNINITDSVVTMDCMESYTLTSETENVETITWISSDPAVVSVDEEGKLTTTVNTGTATITASSGSVSDVCTVTVLAKNIPALNVPSSVVIPKGENYNVSVGVEYNGKNITEHLEFGINAVDDNQQIVAAAMNDNKVTFSALATGKCEFTVYTNVFGQAYAETLAVEVREVGITYLVSGGINNEIRLNSGTEYPLSNVKVYDGGELVSTDTLDWRIEDQRIASIVNGKITGGRAGETRLTATYKGVDLSICVKSIKESIVIDAVETVADVDLDLGITVDPRAYAANPTKTARITLADEVADYGEVVSATLGGTALDASKFSLSGNVAEVFVSAFGTEVYGQQILRISSENDRNIFEFTVPVLLITKSISTKSGLEDAIVVRGRGQQIYGHYVLSSNINFSGYAMGSVYANDWDYNNGFRGVLDGRGYEIQNYKSSAYGLTAQIGYNAVIKNIKFTNVTYSGGNQNSVLARGIRGATIENVSITLSADSTPDASTGEFCGLVAFASQENLYKDVTVDASACNRYIYCLLGKETSPASTYENFNVIGGANVATPVRFYLKGTSAAPEGIIVQGS